MQSKATTVKEYLEELPPERREAIEVVRAAILENLPQGYEETMQYGMITCVVPLSRYPKGYLDDPAVPLPYVSLASQKNHMAVYLNAVYADKDLYAWFVSEYEKSGKKMDIGKSCVRFRELENLPVDLVGRAVARVPVDALIAYYEEARKK